MEAEFCFPRQLRTNPIFSAHHCSRPHAHIGFLKIPTHRHNGPLIASGSIHSIRTNLPSFFRQLSLQRSCLSYQRPNALPVASGDTDGDSASWARSTAALATTTAAVLLACALAAAAAGGMRLERVALAYMKPSLHPALFKRPRGERTVQALLGTSAEEALPELDFVTAKQDFYELLKKKNPDYPQLQELARVLITSKEAKKMIEALQGKFDEFRDRDPLDEQNAVEMGLILAEMLIYRGKYQEALNILHYYFYNSEAMNKNVRPDLFRVAANLMLRNQEEAERNWIDLQPKLESISEPDSEAKEKQRFPSTIREFENALRKQLANVQAKSRWWSLW